MQTMRDVANFSTGLPGQLFDPVQVFSDLLRQRIQAAVDKVKMNINRCQELTGSRVQIAREPGTLPFELRQHHRTRIATAAQPAIQRLLDTKKPKVIG